MTWPPKAQMMARFRARAAAMASATLRKSAPARMRGSESSHAPMPDPLAYGDAKSAVLILPPRSRSPTVCSPAKSSGCFRYRLMPPLLCPALCAAPPWGLLLVVWGGLQLLIGTLGVELFTARTALVVTLIGVVWTVGIGTMKNNRNRGNASLRST